MLIKGMVLVFMKSVLIVDDAVFMRLTLKTMLESNGFQVVGEAENGQMAIEKFSRLRPDIVTMDITMPELDGVAALKEMKAIDKNVKVLMVSAMGKEASVRDAIMAGATGFVVKPFTEEGLMKALSKF